MRKSDYGPSSAIILGDCKLIRFYADGTRQLFDIEKDLGERHDLASEMPDKAQEPDERLRAYLKAVGAQLPTPNPDFDPAKAGEMLRAKRK